MSGKPPKTVSFAPPRRYSMGHFLRQFAANIIPIAVSHPQLRLVRNLVSIIAMGNFRRAGSDCSASYATICSW
ncbi:unnamed protein product [Heligmosomoides polygyrus]|uniref:PTS system protein n=1 Tax=Heligmosomoides polygyrus TaxID=6339 RepID=A0A183F537_HELPZ|nr:unnamed protein product [Heligmosomoides polygyrus]